MSEKHSQLRSVVFEYLLANPQGQINLMGGGTAFATLCGKHGIHFDDQTRSQLLQVFHELYLERVIVTGAGSGTMAMTWPFYQLTEYGEKVIKDGEYTPHDPEGYLARLKRQIPAVDSVVIRYMEEALGSYRANYLLAASVMIGCAAEKVVLQLVDAFGAALAEPTKKTEFEKETKSWMISKKYNALWGRLESLAGSLPQQLGDDLEVILDRVFGLIRTARNEAGHPTGKTPDREVVSANFILFPHYCRRVYDLIDHFASHPIK